MVIVGLTFAMLDRGSKQAWVVPLFGAFMVAVTVSAVRWICGARPSASAAPSPAGPASPPADESHRVAQGPEMPVSLQRTPIEPLSARELEVLHHLATGCTNTQIAQLLFIAPGTVKAHLNHIFRKLDATNRLQAVTHAREADLLD